MQGFLAALALTLYIITWNIKSDILGAGGGTDTLTHTDIGNEKFHLNQSDGAKNRSSFCLCVRKQKD